MMGLHGDFVVRQVVSEEDVLGHLKLRYKVYVDEHHFLPPNAYGIDLTPHDPYSRLFSVFHGDEQVGTIRVVYSNRRGEAYDFLNSLMRNCGIDPERVEPFPSVEPFDFKSLEGFDPERVVEFSRTAIDPPYNNRKLAYALVDGAFAAAINDGFQRGLGSCDEERRGFYEGFGCRVAEELGKEVYPEIGIVSVALDVPLRDLPEPHRAIVGNMGRMLSRDGFAYMCGNPEGTDRVDSKAIIRCLTREDYLDHYQPQPVRNVRRARESKAIPA